MPGPGSPQQQAALLGGATASPWYDSAAILDADFDNARFRYDTNLYGTPASLAAAMGGTSAGNVLSVGPFDTGTVIYQSDFSAGIDGWTESLFPANGDLASAGGNLVATTSATGAYRFAKITPLAARVAVAASFTIVNSNFNSLTVAAGEFPDFSGGNSFTLSPALSGPVPQTITVVASSSASQICAGLSNNAASGQVATISNVVVKQVLPYKGFTNGEVSFEIDFTAPASFATNKVLVQWGMPHERYRVRLLIDTTGRVRFIVTTANVEQVNIDLGVVATSSRHTVKATAKLNAFSASLDGGPLVTDTAGTMPGLGLFWLGRSFTGETFDGAIHRLKVYPTAKSNPDEWVDPAKAFRIYGDSTADGAGSTTDWYQVLTAAYDPDRTWSKNSAGGENTTQMLARVSSSPALYASWPTIFMDYLNTGETAATWIANMKAAAGLLSTSKWYVHPPVQDVPDTAKVGITEIQGLLLSDPFFAGHTLDAAQQAVYFAAMSDAGTRSDGLHDSDAGGVVRANTIKAWADGAGW